MNRWGTLGQKLQPPRGRVKARTRPEKAQATASDIQILTNRYLGRINVGAFESLAWHSQAVDPAGWINFAPGTMFYGPTTGTTTQPTPTDTPFTWLSHLPQTFNQPGFVATILSSESAIFAEAEKMHHCIWKSYRTQISSGRHLSYHIETETPINTRGGKLRHFTVGFEPLPPCSFHGRAGVWRFNQIVGAYDARPEATPDLTAFVVALREKINTPEPK